MSIIYSSGVTLSNAGVSLFSNMGGAIPTLLHTYISGDSNLPARLSPHTNLVIPCSVSFYPNQTYSIATGCSPAGSPEVKIVTSLRM